MPLGPYATGDSEGIFAEGAQAYRVLYDSAEGTGLTFMTLARQLGLMADVKAGVPRTAYEGVVTFRYHGHLVHLALRSDYG